MKATAWEYRYRIWISMLLYVVGFVAPWNYRLHVDGRGPNAHVWGTLAWLLAKTGVVGFGTAFALLLAVAIGFAVLGALLRTWGAAYLNDDALNGRKVRSDRIMAGGPYRFVRNPLYLGVGLFTPVLALLMPPSGAIFLVVTLLVFGVRLMLAEEACVAATPGSFAEFYLRDVPRLLPALRPRVATGGYRPRWAQAFLSEIFMWAVIVSFAAVGWKYNTLLLDRCVLVSLGVALIARAVRG